MKTHTTNSRAINRELLSRQINDKQVSNFRAASPNGANKLKGFILITGLTLIPVAVAVLTHFNLIS